MTSLISATRAALVGRSTDTAPLARSLLAAGIGPLQVVGRTPGEGAEAAALSPDRLFPAYGPEALDGRDLIVVVEGARLEDGELEDLAGQVARRAPEAVVMVTGPRSNRAAASFLRRSRLEPRQVLATGGLPVQLALAGDLAARLGVSRSQVNVLVAGDEGERVRLLERYSSVAGIPLAILRAGAKCGSGPEDDAPSEGAKAGRGPGTEPIRGATPNTETLRRSAVVLAEAVLHDRRQILSCGGLVEAGQGLPAGFMTLPAIVGARGILGRLPLILTVEDRAYLNRVVAGPEA
jgi:malate dehydrogenase